MSLRVSLDLIAMVRPEAGTAAIDHEVMAERAASLGAAEKRVVAAVATLKAGGTSHDDAMAEARKVVWEYFVQRELLGFRKHTDVIQDLGIPPEVLAGLGAMTKSR